MTYRSVMLYRNKVLIMNEFTVQERLTLTLREAHRSKVSHIQEGAVTLQVGLSQQLTKLVKGPAKSQEVS